MSSKPIYRETRFRTPTGAERDVGLWVDRIGAATTRETRAREGTLRLLGQSAVVAIESGSGTLMSARQGRQCVSAGDVIFVAPDDACCYFPNTEWYSRWVVWNGPETATTKRLGYVAGDSCVIRFGARAVNEAWFALVDLMGQEDLGSVLERKLVLLRMILELYRVRERGNAGNAAATVGKKAVEYLTENCSKQLSVPDLAAMFGMSPTHFRRVFKAHTGRSPKQFLLAARISKAKELLVQGVVPKVVASEVGFRDVFYFGRIFKKLTGQSPGRFAAFRQ